MPELQIPLRLTDGSKFIPVLAGFKKVSIQPGQNQVKLIENIQKSLEGLREKAKEYEKELIKQQSKFNNKCKEQDKIKKPETQNLKLKCKTRSNFLMDDNINDPIYENVSLPRAKSFESHLDNNEYKLISNKKQSHYFNDYKKYLSNDELFNHYDNIAIKSSSMIDDNNKNYLDKKKQACDGNYNDKNLSLCNNYNNENFITSLGIIFSFYAYHYFIVYFIYYFTNLN